MPLERDYWHDPNERQDTGIGSGIQALLAIGQEMQRRKRVQEAMQQTQGQPGVETKMTYDERGYPVPTITRTTPSLYEQGIKKLDFENKTLTNRKLTEELNPTGTQTGGAPASISPQAPQEERDQWLSQFPQETQDNVRQFAEYRTDPTKIVSRYRGSQALKSFMSVVEQYTGHAYDLKEYKGQQKYLDDFMGGQTRRNVTRFNTLGHHLGTLQQAIEDLRNTRQPAANAFINFAKTWTGDPTITNLEVAKEAVLNEAQSVFSGIGATQEGLKRAVAMVPNRASYDQMQGFVKTMAQLMDGRGKSVEDAYRDILHKDPGTLVYSASTRQVLDQILGKTNGQVQKTGTPSQPVEGKTYKDAQGNKAVYQNGQYVPVQ